ncbi:hypothetical protein, partial [Actinoplanes xinjiangensis]|uniref:hypothetical protein n=1 Tax=Actinoplanes xinjiangensis TaxID=512350 RepID=UPI001941EBEB
MLSYSSHRKRRERYDMSKATRRLTTAGIGMLAGAAFGMGPANAALHNPPPDNPTDMIGQLGGGGACEAMNDLGSQLGLWTSHNCAATTGATRSISILMVEYREHGPFPQPSQGGSPGAGSTPDTGGTPSTGTAPGNTGDTTTGGTAPGTGTGGTAPGNTGGGTDNTGGTDTGTGGTTPGNTGGGTDTTGGTDAGTGGTTPGTGTDTTG